jgi:hypothetical protein
MPQTGLIFGAISFGFVVFITCKGQLPAYLACFFPNASAATSSTNQASNSTSTTSIAQTEVALGSSSGIGSLSAPTSAPVSLPSGTLIGGFGTTTDVLTGLDGEGTVSV